MSTQFALVPSKIEFKSTTGQYGWLTNFSRRVFTADGIKWKTSEHYYQWLKLTFMQSIGEDIGDDIIQAVVDARTPMMCKRIGHIRVNNIDQWDAIKVDMMMKVLRAKFTNVHLRGLLLSTGDAELVESSYKDNYWGDGGDGRGLNMLGKCLMQLRDELRE